MQSTTGYTADFNVVSCTHKFLQRWSSVQQTLMPELIERTAALTVKLERLIHILKWVRVEEFVHRPYADLGRPAHERVWLAKALLNLPNTTALIERLHIDRSLRRICGFAVCERLRSQATFSRAFEEFAHSRLAERVH